MTPSFCHSLEEITLALISYTIYANGVCGCTGTMAPSGFIYCTGRVEAVLMGTELLCISNEDLKRYTVLYFYKERLGMGNNN